MGYGMGAEFEFARGLWFVAWAAVLLVPFWRIAVKAGYSGWISLLILVPLVNLGLLYFLAFAAWPSARTATSDNG